MVMCTDLPVAHKPIPRLTVAGPHVTDGRSAMPPTGCIVDQPRCPTMAWRLASATSRSGCITDPKGFPRPGEGYGDLRVTGWVTVRAIDEINALASKSISPATPSRSATSSSPTSS